MIVARTLTSVKSTWEFCREHKRISCRMTFQNSSHPRTYLFCSSQGWEVGNIQYSIESSWRDKRPQRLLHGRRKASKDPDNLSGPLHRTTERKEATQLEPPQNSLSMIPVTGRESRDDKLRTFQVPGLQKVWKDYL